MGDRPDMLDEIAADFTADGDAQDQPAADGCDGSGDERQKPTGQSKLCTDSEAFFRKFYRPGDVWEVRAFKCPVFRGANKRRTASGYFDHPQDAAKCARFIDFERRPPGVYCTLNPVDPGLLGRSQNRIIDEAENTTTDEQIVCRRWLLLDIDPVRPPGLSATDDESRAAGALATYVHNELAKDGWPEPLRVMSGNGTYLLYRLPDLPNDDNSTDLIKRVLHGLGNRFDNSAAKIDRSTFNASRIIKVPGTAARKGDDFKGTSKIPARPHRVAGFGVPDGELLPVPVELLLEIAAEAEDHLKPPHLITNGHVRQPGSNGKPRCGGVSPLERCRAYLAAMDPAVSGDHGHDQTLRAACECYRFGCGDAEALALVKEFNSRCQPPWSDAELQHKLADARRKVEEDGQVGIRLKEPGQEQLNVAEFPGQLPRVTLPGLHISITEAAEKLGELLSKTGNFYVRGGVPVRAALSDGEVKLEVLRPAAVCSDFELVARLFKYKDAKDGPVLQPDNCSEAIARQILESQAFRSRLPRICVLSRCPVLVERDGELVTITGFDPASGIWAMGKPPPDMSLDEAESLLNTLLADFHFATPGDRSRAMAALVTPALVFGGLLGGRAPIDAGEADHSQSGKGYRNKLTAAIYRNMPKAVTQREGGVGSLQESFDTALVKGACFPSLDNLRGKIAIAAIESFMTELTYLARVPYSSPAEIDPTRTVVMLTTNKAELTPDMANRASIVRIRKHDDDFKFRRFPEGELLDHVKAHQERYLAAVFAVIREWHRAGKPRLDNATHDFKTWACTLGWIVDKLLHCAPMLTDHREIQLRTASPAGNWLRDLALAVKASGNLGKCLRAHELVGIILERQIETPGISAEVDLEDREQFKKSARLVGMKMSHAVTHDHMAVDGGMQVERTTGHDDEGRERKLYRFLEREGQEQTPTPAAPECAPNAPAMKNPISPIPQVVPQVCNEQCLRMILKVFRALGTLGIRGIQKGIRI